MEGSVGCMGKVVLDVTISLDGFSAGQNIAVDRPMGDGGECLHHWMFGGGIGPATESDRQVANEMFASAGAVVMGRRTFDVGVGLWGDDGAFRMPCFVLTHRAQPEMVKGPTTFTFVTDGIHSGLEKAKAAAGEKDVWLMGAANVAQQYLKAGLVDEMRIHLVPVLFGAGARLFDHIGAEQVRLECSRVIESPFATHLSFDVSK